MNTINLQYKAVNWQRWVPVILLLTAMFMIFSEFFLNQMVFIGDSDRLNTFLNIRKFQVDLIKMQGFVPSWNENMFMGFNLSGLHWMPTSVDLLAYMQSIFPAADLYIVTTFTTILISILTACSGFLFLNYLVEDRYAAAIGGVLYACSSIAILRASQLDNAALGILILPLGLYAIRKYFYDEQKSYLVASFLSVATLLLTTFLQEAAYIIMLYGLYILYLAVALKKVRPFFNICFACGCAVVLAAPRLLTIMQDVVSIERTKTIHYTNHSELLRWVFDGIFGRYPSETISKYNMHEGLQIYTSVTAFITMVLMWGMALGNRKYGAVYILGFCALLSLVFRSVSTDLNRVYDLWILGFFSAAALWLLYNKVSSSGITPRYNNEFWFFTAFFLGCMLAILTVPGRNVVYQLFLHMDFLHSRLSVVAVLPAVIAVAFFIKSLDLTTRKVHLHMLLPALVITTFIILATNGLWIEQANRAIAKVKDLILLQESCIYIGFYVITTLVALALYIANKLPDAYKQLCLYVFVGLLLGGAMQNAKLQYSGMQTKTAMPFENNELYVTNKHRFKIPSEQQIAQARERFETDHYRMSFVAAWKEFPAYYSPHIAQLWHFRLIDGYGAGVPTRLTRFPWVKGVNNLRGLRFSNWDQVPWDLLAMLNVKYAASLNNAVYFNDGDALAPEKIVENPYATVPRAFFAKKILPLEYDFKADNTAIAAQVGAASIGNKVLLYWDLPNDYNYQNFTYHIEMQDPDTGSFNYVASTQEATFLSADLLSGKEYKFRVRKQNSQGIDAARSNEIVVMPGADNIDQMLSLPSNINGVVLDANTLHITWENAHAYINYKVRVASAVDAIDHTYNVKGKHEVYIPWSTPGEVLVHIDSCYGSKCTTEPAVVKIVRPATVMKQYPATYIDIGNGQKLFANPQELSMVENFAAAQQFDTTGDLKADFRNDKITVNIQPAHTERFLVLNEMYHHTWKAYANNQELQVYPVNLVMRGVVVPPNVSVVYFENIPFIKSKLGMLIGFAAVLMFAMFVVIPKRNKK